MKLINWFSLIQKTGVHKKYWKNTKKLEIISKNEKSLSNWFLFVQMGKNHFKSEKTLKQKIGLKNNKITFSFIQKLGNQFKKWKNTEKEEISLKNDKSLFKLIFIYSKKGKSVQIWKTLKRGNQFQKKKIHFQTDFRLFKKGWR